MPNGTERTDTDVPVRVLTVLGLLAVVVVLACAVALVVSWPTTPRRATALPIRLHAYDPTTATITDVPPEGFRRGRLPAASLDENAAGSRGSEPARASWYDPLGHRTNSVEVSELADLAASPVPVSVASAVPAGTYHFVLVTVDDGEPTEVLAWLHVDIRW